MEYLLDYDYKEESKKNNRFNIIKLLGEGSFSKTYSAFDTILEKKVALKIEKPEKEKRVLKMEYDTLKVLQKCNSVPIVYDFIENSDDKSFIVMELLGINISNFIKLFNPDVVSCVNILVQMLCSIEDIHNLGYVHRDIKPSNFVMGNKEGTNKDKIYIVDFGLAKNHLDKNGNPHTPKKQSEFRGTLTYASMNAHNKKELGRRDDLFSFFFIVLEMLGVKLPWRDSSKKANREEVAKNKDLCLNNPDNFIFLNQVTHREELRKIFDHIIKLNYETKPNYLYIKEILENIQDKIIFGHEKIRKLSSLEEVFLEKENENIKKEVAQEPKNLLVNKRLPPQLNHQSTFIKENPIVKSHNDNLDEYEDIIVENKLMLNSDKICSNDYPPHKKSSFEEGNSKLKPIIVNILKKQVNETTLFDIIFLYHFQYNKLFTRKRKPKGS